MTMCLVPTWAIGHTHPVEASKHPYQYYYIILSYGFTGKLHLNLLEYLEIFIIEKVAEGRAHITNE